MKNNKEEKNDDWFNEDQIRSYMKVPAGKKLDHTEEAARWLNKITPRENKIAWEKLKEQGY